MGSHMALGILESIDGRIEAGISVLLTRRKSRRIALVRVNRTSARSSDERARSVTRPTSSMSPPTGREVFSVHHFAEHCSSPRHSEYGSTPPFDRMGAHVSDKDRCANGGRNRTCSNATCNKATDRETDNTARSSRQEIAKTRHRGLHTRGCLRPYNPIIREASESNIA